MSHLIDAAVLHGARPICPDHGAPMTVQSKQTARWGHYFKGEADGKPFDGWCVLDMPTVIIEGDAR